MLLEIENCLLSIEREPYFRLTVCRGENLCLRSAPHPQPVLSIRQTDTGADVQFPACTLSLTRNGHGCDLQIQRQWDKWSTWGLDNGLYSVLTGIVSLGLSGYPFILPDMIGGNAYGEQPDAELMIRWTQLNTLLPTMQFSLAPWDYSAESNALCRRYAQLHLEFAARILELAREAARTGAPIIRPVWWLAPNDERALTCDDQFLLGSDVLAAPVVQPGQRSRAIYLPPGQWRDHWTGALYDGETVLQNFPAPLETLPIFVKMS